MQRGLADYDAAEKYMTGARIIGDDGKTYKSIVDSNTGHTPSSSPTQWERWGYTATEITALVNNANATFIVRVASTTAVTIAAPGTTIDGVTMVSGDRFLEKDNGTGSARGIYVWNGAAVPATRATDADAGTELKAGSVIEVTEGTVNADTLWTLTTDGVITIGSTSLAFARVNDSVYLKKAGGTMTGALALAGGDTGTTATPGNSTTLLATTAFVTGALATLSSAVTAAIAAAVSGLASLSVVNLWTKSQAGAVVALTDAATITPDFSLANNFSLTIGGNRTLANPTNIVAGQSGVISVTQDGTGGRTLAFGAYYKFPAGVIPTLTAAAASVDDLAYYVKTATLILIVQQGDTK
jgi:hypothetical protein